MKTAVVAISAATALAVVPAGAVAYAQPWNNYHVTVAAAPAQPTPSTSNGSSGSSSGSSGSSGQDGSQVPQYGGGWWGQNGGQGSNGSSSAGATTSGTAVSSQQGVVMIDTVLNGGEGAGTGIVLNSNGTILTNYHVVADSTSIRVTAADGKTYTGKVVGFDEAHDIAVVKISGATNLTAAKFDTTPTVGESVTAVGQGGGLGSLYKTSGSVTASNQQITASDDSSGSNSETLTGLLQTNAQIVPGYSGGPLFDAQGEVIGMDTAASSSTPITGYAITSANALSYANLITSGTKTTSNHLGSRAALGVGISTQTQQSTGAAVMQVTTGSAAQKAGITAGDTIISLGGKQVADGGSLGDLINRYYPGQQVSVGWVDANGASHTATVTLGTATTN
ncbi:S1C family serine protease [Calidifontibacter terrae]